MAEITGKERDAFVHGWMEFFRFSQGQLKNLYSSAAWVELEQQALKEGIRRADLL